MGSVPATIQRIRVYGLAPTLGYTLIWAPRISEFPTLWLVNTPEIGDTTCGFNDPSILSVNMGARGCVGR
jgi:hypothetical protein